MAKLETVLREMVEDGDYILTDNAGGDWLASDLLNELHPDDLAYEVNWDVFNDVEGIGTIRKLIKAHEAGEDPMWMTRRADPGEVSHES